MDFPTQDASFAGLGIALIIAVGGYLGTNAVDWIVGVNDTVDTVEHHTGIIDDMSDDVKAIRSIVTEDHAQTAAIKAEVEIIKDITIENRTLGKAFRDSLED